MKSAPRWTADQIDSLKKMAADGYDAREIARRLKRRLPPYTAGVQVEGVALERGRQEIEARRAAGEQRSNLSGVGVYQTP
jgi:primosomal protein N'